MSDENKREILEPLPMIDLSQPEDVLARHTLNWESDARARIAEAVNQADEYLRVRLTEDRFEEAFLPLFTGEPSRYPEINLYTYTNFVGGPNRELSITNALTGQEILRVPPIFSHDKINFNTPRDPQNTYYELLGRINQIGGRLPIKASRLLLLQGAKKWESVKNKEQYFELFKRWNIVFAHYGRDVVRIKGFSDEELGIPSGYVATKAHKTPDTQVSNQNTTSTQSAANQKTSIDDLAGWDEDDD